MTLTCEATAHECRCILPTDSHEVHECSCGGQWKGSEPDFQPVRPPQRYADGRPTPFVNWIFEDD